MLYERSYSPDYFLTKNMVLGQARFHAINGQRKHRKNLFSTL